MIYTFQSFTPTRWLAPEVRNIAMAHGESYTSRLTRESQSWSLGILLWEIVSFGATPYTQYHTTHEFISAVTSATDCFPPQRLEYVDDELWLLMYCINIYSLFHFIGTC